MKKRRYPVFAAALAIALAAAAFAAETTLVADSMRYDPKTGVITARGNVRVTNPGGEIFSDSGIGLSDGSRIEMRGNVRGHYKDKDGNVVNFSCAAASIDGRRGADRVVTASGGVRLSKGKDTLTARSVVWHTSTDRYSASGDVLGEFETYSIDADMVSRDINSFSAQTVRKFRERSNDVTMSASRASGLIKNGEVTDVTAEGGVVMTMPDKDGVMTRAAGDRGVYSRARGTLVLSGGAVVTQAGRALRSESVVYFLGTGRMDALGKPSLTLETDGRK